MSLKYAGSMDEKTEASDPPTNDKETDIRVPKTIAQPCPTCSKLSNWTFILTCTQILSILAILSLCVGFYIGFQYILSLVNPFYAGVQGECFNRIDDPEKYKNDVAWTEFCHMAFSWPQANSFSFFTSSSNDTHNILAGQENSGKSDTVATSSLAWSAARCIAGFGAWCLLRRGIRLGRADFFSAVF